MAHNKLYRNFIILQEDEKGHGISEEKPLSGYAKIEAKSDKCKISFYAQNLNKDDKYTIVLICYKKDMKQMVDLGSLEVTEVGKGEACKEYYINNIAGLDFSYEKISGAAICKYKDGELSFLMYGFMNGENVKDGWKKCKVLKHADKDDKIFKHEDKDEKMLKKDIPKVEVALIKEKGNKKEEGCKKDYHEHLDKEDYCKNQEKYIEKIHKEEDCHKQEDGCGEHHEEEYIHHHEKEHIHDDEEEHIHHHEKEHTHDDEEEHIHHHDKDHMDEHQEKYSHKNKDDYDYNDNYYGDEEYGFVGEKHDERIENVSKFDQYESTIENNKDYEESINLNGDIGKFFTDIMDGFEEYKPRSKDIKYCKWYKVNIKSLDDMCNVSNYNKYTVAYYPMLNYYPYIRKYGYFMIGYKCDQKGNLKYIVYGVPGNKDESEQPYAGKTGFVTWMNMGDRDEGCWLMFYDFRNSTIVVPMK